ncbi:hypothetical protein OGM63_10950 [Plectonema radiosum NIES-515]|uniref:Uncharacterized protein n=1 Tax=Plectonema radiosum NIES-515 TaxID=2986073 RepID=A0ABT3AY31_9CYAN|nr:hypothetical protein [Plectonema radiosum]MCV3214025.1 hypothetical protein [Plectonema radiosum NIES-515]
MQSPLTSLSRYAIASSPPTKSAFIAFSSQLFLHCSGSVEVRSPI